MAEAELSTRRKRRGVVRASATRLKGKVRELESKTDHPDTPSHARRILSSCSVTTTHEGKRLASRKLDRLKRRLEAVTEAIAATDVDV